MAFWKSAQPEYTEATAPAVTPRPKPATAPAASARPVSKDRLQIVDEKHNVSAKKGFDPYNSGAFDTRQTWERVIRK